MKVFSLLLLLLIGIEYIASKKTVVRNYIVQRNNEITFDRLSPYTVYDSSGKNILYELKSTSTDIDTIVVTDYPAENMVANVEGQWVANMFNVTFSIYDKKLGKWNDGIITRNVASNFHHYDIFWNNKNINSKGNFFWTKVQVYNTKEKELLAEFKTRYWSDNGVVQMPLKTYSDKFPDFIYFFVLAINDHRLQESGNG